MSSPECSVSSGVSPDTVFLLGTALRANVFDETVEDRTRDACRSPAIRKYRL